MKVWLGMTDARTLLFVLPGDHNPKEVSLSERSLKWLHISDLHFRNTSDPDRSRVLDALLRDLDHHGSGTDLLFLTGDIAFSGKRDEYERARTWLESHLLPRIGLSWSDVYMVPGNHDVDRTVSNPALYRPVVEARDPAVFEEELTALCRHQASQNFIHEKFANYLEFVRAVGAPGPAKPDESWYTALISRGGFRVHIAGINTAWAAGYDGDERQRLLVGRSQMDSVSVTESLLPHVRMLLAHHPLGMLHPFDLRTVNEHVEAGFDFLLSGHLHDQASEGQPLPRSGTVRLVAGASYVQRQFKHAYNVVELTRCAIRVRLRSYSPQTQFYGADTLLYREASEDGVLSWQWRYRPRVYIGGSTRHCGEDLEVIIKAVARRLAVGYLDAGISVWSTCRVPGVGAEVWAAGWEWCERQKLDPTGLLGDAGLFPVFGDEWKGRDPIQARSTYIGYQDLLVALGGSEGTAQELLAAGRNHVPVVAAAWSRGAAGSCNTPPAFSDIQEPAGAVELTTALEWADAVLAASIEYLWTSTDVRLHLNRPFL